MDQQLKLTARGHAVCELMAALGLSLEAACARVEHELETLRQRVHEILTESDWEDVPGAMRTALESVSPGVQNAYLEESARDGRDTVPPSAPHPDTASVH
jgi:hypothetical protein